MNRLTVDRLNRLNLDFYDSHGDHFSQTREGPWPGWDTLLERLPALDRSLSVLDAGCGNGRFGRFLEERLKAPFDYTGIDSSARLLEHARTRLASGVGSRELLVVDLMREAPSTLLASRRFDLVAAFGLTHHLPGLANRRALLADLARLVASGGLLAVAFWQFADEERFQRRMVSWQEYNRGSDEPVALDQLERGDHLLTWGQRSAAVRYCHHSDDAEVEELLATLSLRSAGSFRSSAPIDRLNRYELLLGAPATASPSS